MSDPPALDLSIVVPAWNERATLELLLPALRQVREDIVVSRLGRGEATLT